MKSTFSMKQISAAVVSAFLVSPMIASAADPKPAMAADKAAPAASRPAATHAATPATPATPASPAERADRANDRPNYSDRALSKPWSNDKERLEQALKLGEGKDFYAKALADQGYLVTSINKDKDDYLEYEVVKGNHTYEVQIDFEKGGKAKKVDVTTNMWRSDATKAALRGTKTEVATKALPANEAYSDRTRMKDWSNEKEKLEKSLALGNDKAYYANQLKKMGYQITSTNDQEKDYVEYEVVKGRDSYEVQIDFEGGKAKKVDVTTNMWQSDATDKALNAKKNDKVAHTK